MDRVQWISTEGKRDMRPEMNGAIAPFTERLQISYEVRMKINSPSKSANVRLCAQRKKDTEKVQVNSREDSHWSTIEAHSQQQDDRWMQKPLRTKEKKWKRTRMVLASRCLFGEPFGAILHIPIKSNHRRRHRVCVSVSVRCAHSLSFCLRFFPSVFHLFMKIQRFLFFALTVFCFLYTYL